MHVFYKLTKWFTLFFIPIIPYSSQYLIHCNACGLDIEVDNDDAKSLLEGPGERGLPGGVEVIEQSSELNPTNIVDSAPAYIGDDSLESSKNEFDSENDGEDEYECLDCGTPVNPDAKFCANCGIEFEDEEEAVTCLGCGDQVEEDWAFCRSCGEALSADESDVDEEMVSMTSDTRKKDIKSGNGKQRGDAGSEDYIKELEQLARLNESGVITDEEFDAKKKAVLGLEK